MTARAELSSLASTLADLVRRVTALADEAHAAGDTESAADLFAVERSLAAGLRRLERAAGL